MQTQLVMWPVLAPDKARSRKGAETFASGFVLELKPPAWLPEGAEGVERKAARLREIEEREGR